jgi:hypothetical protein
MEAMKEGLIEKSAIGDVEKKLGMKRDNPGQTVDKPAAEKASKGGKSFKIQ